MTVGFILLICVSALLVGSVPFIRSWGYYPTAAIGLVVVVLLLLILLGRL